jgi:hypothetical protein
MLLEQNSTVRYTVGLSYLPNTLHSSVLIIFVVNNQLFGMDVCDL